MNRRKLTGPLPETPLVSRCVRWCVLLACLASPAAAQDASLVLGRGRAGALALGMTRDSVLRVVDSVRVMDLTNCTETACLPALGIFRGTNVEKSAVFARLRERPRGTWRIASLEVSDPAYRTPEGVGVGTTRATLERTYQTTRNPNDLNERYAPTLSLWFRVSGATRTSEAQVVAVIVRDPSPARPAPPRCDARTPPDLR